MAAVEGEPDAFDAIVMAETRKWEKFVAEATWNEGFPAKWLPRFHGEGYQDGYAEGVHAGVVEGRQHGIQQGASIGSEIGSYLGFALTWQQLLQKTSAEKCSKKIKVLELLIEMIQNFPLEDPAYDKLQDDLEKIRGRFKQICSLLHIPSDLRLGSERISFSF
ncbi:protein LTO1 homolog isoform X2 [Crotalus tigris]|uniref:protein LTO1 homolog isoform X2 n=1 Tax=Crotalus tigris TaxID=88082 RepID=UPI00192FA0EC|nr:protein LTO1 homolog isoform X2 [Crotalus tigris]